MPAQTTNFDEGFHFKDVHPDWRGDIGQTIDSDVLREFVFSDKRNDRQLLKRIFRKHEIAQANHEDVKHIDVYAMEALFNNKEQFLLVAGMVWYANYLSSLIAPGQLTEMLNGLHLDMVKKVVRKRELAPESYAQNFDPERAKASMIETGTRIVIAWAQNLPTEFCGKIALMFPKKVSSPDQSYDLESLYATQIVRIVPELLVNSVKSLPAEDVLS